MSQKTKIEIALLLPTLPDTRDACVQRLGDLLKANEGIESAHVENIDGNEPGHICIHYNPDRLTIGDVRELAHRAGMELEKRFGHLLLQTEPMHARQALTVESRARQIPGVLEAAASPAGLLRIEFDCLIADEAAIRLAVETIGVQILHAQKQPSQAELPKAGGKLAEKKYEHRYDSLFNERTELFFAALCGVLLLSGWLLSAFTTITPWVPWSFYLGAYVFGGIFMLRDAIADIRAGRFEIDFLMLVAAAGAASLGEWAEGALLLFLFSLGHSLEHFAMGRAKRAIEALAELAPQTALRRRQSSSEEVPVEELQLGTW
jgi:Cd2+/Zn2+-exporting ATPase